MINKKNFALKSSVTRNSPSSFLNISMSTSIISFIPLSTYNVKDFLNNSKKLLSLLMFQKVFSMQMSSAVGIKMRIRLIDKSHTSKEAFSRPAKMRRDNSFSI